MGKGIFYESDTDTIGSIIRQMTGILFGVDAINIKWLNTIENLNLFSSLLLEL